MKTKQKSSSIFKYYKSYNHYNFKGAVDRNSVAEYSVTVYYTSTFRKFTADPETFIEQVQ